MPLLVLMVACQTTPHWAPYDAAKQDTYPAKHWQKAQSPEQLGWSSEKLAAAREYSKQIDTAALMIVDNGKVGLDLVLDGDTIKWYDLEGTLGGKGDYSRIN